jgi:hypothetical protein
MTSYFERGPMGTRHACGYLTKGFLISATEVELRQLITRCAAAKGIALDAIYEEELDRPCAQLTVCIDSLLEAGESYLIVPRLLHLAGFNNPLEVRRDLRSRGIEVVVAQTQPA